MLLLTSVKELEDGLLTNIEQFKELSSLSEEFHSKEILLEFNEVFVIIKELPSEGEVRTTEGA